MAKKTSKTATTASRSPRNASRASKAGKRSKRAGGGPTTPATAGNGGPMDVTLLERLMSLMSDHGLSNLELKEGDNKIALSRGGAPLAMAPAPAAAPAIHAAPTPAPAPAPAPAPPEPARTDASDLKEITSPMVGTFYTASGPDAKPFVSVGSRVGPDTDVCIIEAMKVFNTIKAEISGTIERILIENGQPVEYGQALFLVKPA